MSTKIRARVRNGRLEPLQAVELPEGAEVDIIIVPHHGNGDLAAFRSSFGGWKGTFDPDESLAGLRQSLTRPEPKL
jgi:predicted DNA-binding antitoxin AbrB/MazE fold protein